MVLLLQDLPTATPHCHHESGRKAWTPPGVIWRD